MKILVIEVVVLVVIIKDVNCFGYSRSTGCIPKPKETYTGKCAFPCINQKTVYQRAFNDVGNSVLYGSDPTLYTVLNKTGVVQRVWHCITQDNDFYLIRLAIPGNDTHANYRCYKDVSPDQSGDFIVRYQSPLKIFKDVPWICDVCTGTDMQIFVLKNVSQYRKIGQLPAFGCNLPSVCRKTKKGQCRCPCADPDEFDDGFCCQKDRSYQERREQRKHIRAHKEGY